MQRVGEGNYGIATSIAVVEERVVGKGRDEVEFGHVRYDDGMVTKMHGGKLGLVFEFKVVGDGEDSEGLVIEERQSDESLAGSIKTCLYIVLLGEFQQKLDVFQGIQANVHEGVTQFKHQYDRL